MLAVLANQTSAVIKFRLTQSLFKFHRKNEHQLKMKNFKFNKNGNEQHKFNVIKMVYTLNANIQILKQLLFYNINGGAPNSDNFNNKINLCSKLAEFKSYKIT